MARFNPSTLVTTREDEMLKCSCYCTMMVPYVIRRYLTDIYVD